MTVERELARMADRSHGVVTRRQLLAGGISADQLKHRVRNGSLIRVHTAVYRVGHRAPSLEAGYMAAVKACGEGALLSGRAAAYLWGLLKGPPPPAEVTAPTARHLKGIKTSHARRAKKEATTWKGIPITTVARTLVDLAAAVDETELARACHEAGVRHYTTPEQVERVLARQPNAKGAGKLRAVMRGEVKVTLSRLEERFLERLREADLPLPQTNRPAGTKRVDCRWPDHQLTVELDSYRYHRTRHAWENDRRREREAYARDDQIRRYTWNDVTQHPDPMLAELRALLSA